MAAITDGRGRFIEWRKPVLQSQCRRRGYPDDSACEGVFGRMKNEMFYYASWAGYSIEQFICAIDQYLYRCCEKRIKLSLGGMRPLEYRRSKGLLTQNSTALIFR